MRDLSKFPIIDVGCSKSVTHHIKNICDDDGNELNVPVYGNKVGQSFDAEDMRIAYDLQALIKANVPLKEVSCLLDPSSTDALCDRSDKLQQRLAKRVVDYETLKYKSELSSDQTSDPTSLENE